MHFIIFSNLKSIIMSIIKNFRNPWEDDNWVLQTDVLDTSVLDTNVLNNDVLKPPTTDKGRGTHFYDESGNLIYKSRYGVGAAITILAPELVENFKDNFGLNSNPVILPKEDDKLIRYYRQRYGTTYLIKDMLQIYEKSKIEKRTIYKQYDENGDLKIPAFIVSNSSSRKLVKVPVEVACPLYLNGYGEVIVGDFKTELAIGNSPLHIYDSEVNRIKGTIKDYSVGFLHTEPIVGLKNVSERNGAGIYPCEEFHADSKKGPSGFDEDYYKPEEFYFSVIVRPFSVLFFKTKDNYFRILKKDLPK
jgi:hypothetical protein